MQVVDIPGRDPLRLEHVLFDLNGTLAKDGQLIKGVPPLFERVRDAYACLVLTGDTFGTAQSLAAALGCPVRPVRTGEDKALVVRELGAGVVAVGNGMNDVPMLEAAALSIVVIGPEGAAGRAIRAADIIAPDIHAALELLLSPKRLTATLRP